MSSQVSSFWAQPWPASGLRRPGHFQRCDTRGPVRFSDRPFLPGFFGWDGRERHSLQGDLIADVVPFRWLDERVMGYADRMQRALDLPFPILEKAL